MVDGTPSKGVILMGCEGQLGVGQVGQEDPIYIVDTGRERRKGVMHFRLIDAASQGRVGCRLENTAYWH